MTTSNVAFGRSRLAKTTMRMARKGFTLVEILVVVAIIGVLATILIGNFKHAKQTSAVAASKANMKQIATAIETYNNDTQNYPASGNVTPQLFANGPNPAADYLQTATNSPGLGGGVYVYTTNGTGDYTIQDPATYEQGTIVGVEKATTSGGVVTDSGQKCDRSCTQLGYSNTTGLFGS